VPTNVILRLKCTKFYFCGALPPDSTGFGLTTLPRPLSCIKRLTSGGGKRGEGKEAGAAHDIECGATSEKIF